MTSSLDQIVKMAMDWSAVISYNMLYLTLECAIHVRNGGDGGNWQEE